MVLNLLILKRCMTEYPLSMLVFLMIRPNFIFKLRIRLVSPENTHHKGKDHCMTGLLFKNRLDSIAPHHTSNNTFSSLVKSNVVKMQTSCLYSDRSPYGECSGVNTTTVDGLEVQQSR